MAIESSALKNKLSMLWIFAGFVWLIDIALPLWNPIVAQQIAAGQSEASIGMFTLIGGAKLALPLMAFLTQTLKNYANRWTNIIVGVIFTAFGLTDAAETLMNSSAWWNGIVVAAMVAVPAVIVWYAYRWPKEEVKPLKAPTPVQKEAIRR